MSDLIKFWEEQLEMHQWTVTELERMWHETFNELKELESYYSDGDMPPYIVNDKDRLLNEMRDYRTAIRRNKASIEKCKLRIEALKRK